MPHPFKTLAEANEAHALLVAEQAANCEALAAAQGQAQKNFADLTAVTAERDSFKAKVDELTGVNAELATGLNDAKAKIEAHAAELTKAQEVTVTAVNAQAVAIIAAGGHAALKLQGGGDEGEKTMSRADFNALKPFEQSAFIRGGGRLSE